MPEHLARASTDDQRDSAYRAFLAAHPGYDATAIDDLRSREFARLDDLGHVYLDYTGGGLYASSQITSHHELLAAGVFGNPHSQNPTSLAATELVERARAAVHTYFNAPPDEYDVIFTHNASGALKLVGESYPFGENAPYLLAYDNHNSVNGIREYARRAGARINYVPVRPPDLSLDSALLERALAGEVPPGGRGLFAYPAQSNFSGVQHTLEWVDLAHEHRWDVLLDSAAFVPTNRLDLSRVHPDFVCVSFYKMFGYPTGAGALIARREALARLRRPWFAGGTITLASVQGEGWYHLAPGHVGFEDGTLDYLCLPAVTIGLELLGRVGIDAIHDRVSALTAWTLGQMSSLTHTSGAPLVRIFGPTTPAARGGTIAFYLLDPSGAVYDVRRIEELAGARRISVRTGCFCNPGDGEIAHGITRDDMESCFADEQVPVTLADCQRIIEDSTGKVPNTIRISFGLASNFDDAQEFLTFAEEFRDRDCRELG